MIGKIATITKTAQKKNANHKDIKLLNRASEAAACLVELVNTEREKNFSTLAEMQEHCKNTWQNMQRVKQRNLPMKVVTTKKKMTNRCFDK